MTSKIKKLIGANMEIEISNSPFGDSKCPWDNDDKSTEHKCAVKSVSICKYFCGVQYLDSILCSYPHENISVLKQDEMDRDMKK